MEQVSSTGRPVQITVTDGYDLKGFKGDTPVTFIRAEFNQVVLGDSAKITISPEGTAKYNFTSSFEFNPEGGITLEDLAHKPVFLAHLLEYLPKTTDCKIPHPERWTWQSIQDSRAVLSETFSVRVT